MLYSETKYPDTMKQLPEDLRRTAIEITNQMLLDGDVRHHKDLIILIAIQKAEQLVNEKSDPKTIWAEFRSLGSMSEILNFLILSQSDEDHIEGIWGVVLRTKKYILHLRPSKNWL